MFKEAKQGKGNVHTPTYTYALTDVAGNTGNIRFVANTRERRACEAAFTKREFHIRFLFVFRANNVTSFLLLLLALVYSWPVQNKIQ